MYLQVLHYRYHGDEYVPNTETKNQEADAAECPYG